MTMTLTISVWQVTVPLSPLHNLLCIKTLIVPFKITSDDDFLFVAPIAFVI